MKLLLIDDDAFLRDMYVKKFSEAGHEISAAESGAAALRLVEQDPKFDLILMDMVMPGVTGIELMESLRDTPKGKKYKFVILSNQGQQSDIEAATDAGADGYIIKAETIPSAVVKLVEDIVNK